MITAITVRISLIEARRDLTARAWGLLAVLFDVLVAALCSLAPIERIVTGLLLVAFGGDIARNFLLYLLSKAPPKPSEVWPFITSAPVVIILAPIPTVVGGIGLAIHRGGGLYWAGFGLILTLGYAVLFLWGLLFEPGSTDEDRQSHTRPDLPADLDMVGRASGSREQLHNRGISVGQSPGRKNVTTIVLPDGRRSLALKGAPAGLPEVVARTCCGISAPPSYLGGYGGHTSVVPRRGRERWPKIHLPQRRSTRFWLAWAMRTGTSGNARARPFGQIRTHGRPREEGWRRSSHAWVSTSKKLNSASEQARFSVERQRKSSTRTASTPSGPLTA